mmetsp:Transcript_20372/g.50855  ORF Transcript_20372/g.50855 Transcript_20372/m.50855 type:complete len:208 (+) Transcript_20372:446-1069(+)
MVPVLPSAGHLVPHAGRVPGANAGNLAQATVRLAWEALDAPAGDNTLVPVTLGGTQHVDELALSEDGVHGHLLLEQGLGELHLGVDVTTVDLDLQHVGHLLAQAQEGRLGVSHDADEVSVGGQVGQAGFELAVEVLSSGVLGEGLLLGVVPVLVEAAADLLVQGLGPHGLQGAQALGGLLVPDDCHGDNGGGLHDGDSLADLLLVGD